MPEIANRGWKSLGFAKNKHSKFFFARGATRCISECAILNDCPTNIEKSKKRVSYILFKDTS